MSNMLLILRAFALLALCSHTALAAEAAAHGDGDPYLQYKIVNFAILAAGIGFLVVKVLFPAFRNQQKEILEAMDSAERRAAEASTQAAEIDRRMAGIEDEIAQIRQKAQLEMEAEASRLGLQTQTSLEKIARSAEAEIASITKAARQELKIYSAGLAIDLAKQKIQSRLDDPAHAALVSRFVSGLTPDVVEKN
jgi:F0F1-type ATP synthase membrane subunit b/b'